MLKRINVYLSVLFLPLVLAGARPAFAQHTGVGSVTAVSGDLMVKGPDDTEWSYIEKNGVVSDGDMLWCDQDSLAEIAAEHGAWLRLGPDTRVDVLRLPPDGQVRVQRGSVYADLSSATRTGMEVRTSAGRVTVQPGALTRVDLNNSGETRLLVRRGRATARPADGGSRTLGAGTMATFRPGSSRIQLAALNESDLDAFDDWNDSRVDFYANQSLPPGVTTYVPGIYEIADYGDWVNYNGGEYWHPTSIEEDWRPYNDGYWTYWHGQPLWTSYDPWGYTTSHYGRWTWSQPYGWLWRPGYTWGPAWVSWANYGDNVLWAPLDPFGRPVYRGGRGNLGQGLLDLAAWSMMPRDNFYRHDPGRILALDRARGIDVRRVRPAPVTAIRQLIARAPREARVRGRLATSVATVPAPQKAQALQKAPPRRDFRVATTPALQERLRRTPSQRVGGWRQGTTTHPQPASRVVAPPVTIRPSTSGNAANNAQSAESQRQALRRAQQERATEQARRRAAEQARAQAEQDRARLQRQQQAAQQEATHARQLAAQQEQARRQAEQQAAQERAARQQAEQARQQAEQERAAARAQAQQLERQQRERQPERQPRTLERERGGDRGGERGFAQTAPNRGGDQGSRSERGGSDRGGGNDRGGGGGGNDRGGGDHGRRGR